MENKVWNENLEALEQMLCGWGNFFKEEKYGLASEEENRFVKEADFSIEQSYTGEMITVVNRNSRRCYLAGKYNPNVMAARMAEAHKGAGLGTIIFVIGFSDGRVLRELLKVTDKSVTILVYEPCMDLFIHALQNYDLRDVFLNRKIGLFIEGINEKDLYHTLKNVITVDNMTKVKTLIMGNYEVLFEQEVKNVIEIEKEIIMSLRVMWNTTLNFRNQSVFNIIRNMKYLYHHCSVNTLFKKLEEDVPVIVVAAGPSLDKNIDLLKKAKGKACIIACDTALKPLLSRDIVPDFFVVIDPKKPLELFDESRIPQIPSITGLNVPYKFMDLHKGKKFIYFDVSFMSYIFQYVFGECRMENAVSAVPTGGSVATTAFSIGHMMGAKRIILVGQDLALSEGKFHVSGAFKMDREVDTENTKYPMVESIDGGEVPTLHNLKMYLEWFEKQIKALPYLHVIDATEGGALIHGSEVMTLQEAIDTYCISEFHSEDLIEQSPKHFSEKEQVKILEFFKMIPGQLDELEEKVKKGKELYQKLKKQAEKKQYSLKRLKSLLKQIKELNEEFDKDPLVQLLTEAIRGVEYTLRTTMYQMEEDEKKDLIESARIGECFLEGIRIAIRDLRPEFEALAEFDGNYPETDEVKRDQKIAE